MLRPQLQICRCGNHAPSATCLPPHKRVQAPQAYHTQHPGSGPPPPCAPPSPASRAPPSQAGRATQYNQQRRRRQPPTPMGLQGAAGELATATAAAAALVNGKLSADHYAAGPHAHGIDPKAHLGHHSSMEHDHWEVCAAARGGGDPPDCASLPAAAGPFRTCAVSSCSRDAADHHPFPPSPSCPALPSCPRRSRTAATRMACPAPGRQRQQTRRRPRTRWPWSLPLSGRRRRRACSGTCGRACRCPSCSCWRCPAACSAATGAPRWPPS